MTKYFIFILLTLPIFAQYKSFKSYTNYIKQAEVRADTVYGAEMITNGTFDSDVSGWNALNTPTTHEWVASGGGFTGALHVVGGAINKGTIQGDLNIEAGKMYRLQADVYRVNLSVRGVLFTDQYEPQVYTYSSGNLQQIDVIFTAVTTDAAAWVWVFQLTSSGAGEFYLDNVSLREVVSLP